MRVQIHELDVHLLERALSQQVTLDPAERLVRVVKGLLNQTELFTLILIQASRHGVVLFQTLER